MESDSIRLVPAVAATLLTLLLVDPAGADNQDWRSLDELAKGHVRRAAALLSRVPTRRARSS